MLGFPSTYNHFTQTASNPTAMTALKSTVVFDTPTTTDATLCPILKVQLLNEDGSPYNGTLLSLGTDNKVYPTGNVGQEKVMIQALSSENKQKTSVKYDVKIYDCSKMVSVTPATKYPTFFERIPNTDLIK